MARLVIPARGQRFGRWLVLGNSVRDAKHAYVMCACDCGSRKSVRVSRLWKGETTSCGCSCVRHGRAVKSGDLYLYKVYRRLIKVFRDRVCDRWANGEGLLSGIDCFAADMGARPPGLRFSQLDHDGPFSPQNCGFMSRAEIALRRRQGVAGIPWDRLSLEMRGDLIRARLLFARTKGRRTPGNRARAFQDGRALARRVLDVIKVEVEAEALGARSISL